MDKSNGNIGRDSVYLRSGTTHFARGSIPTPRSPLCRFLYSASPTPRSLLRRSPHSTLHIPMAFRHVITYHVTRDDVLRDLKLAALVIDTSRRSREVTFRISHFLSKQKSVNNFVNNIIRCVDSSVICRNVIREKNENALSCRQCSVWQSAG